MLSKLWSAETQRISAEVTCFCPYGNRRKDGVTFLTGVEREQENLAYDAKGESQAGSPRKSKSTNAYARGGTSRSSVEVMETSWSEGDVLFQTKTIINFPKEELWQRSNHLTFHGRQLVKPMSAFGKTAVPMALTRYRLQTLQNVLI